MEDRLRKFKAGIFQALANPTRIAIVELLRDAGEVPVTQIHDFLDIEQSNTSQHLAVLRNKRVVTTRKQGNQVFYRLRDKALGKVLDLLKQYFISQLSEESEMLTSIKSSSS
ncbi:MAG: metalloregulator ArsR/SmtB family transcription factor [Gemmatales bacterium]